MQDDHAGRKLHGRGDGVVIPADANAIDVAVIGGDYGIPIATISLVAPLRPLAPFGRLVSRLRCAQCDEEHDGRPVPDVHFFSPGVKVTEKAPWNTAVALVSRRYSGASGRRFFSERPTTEGSTRRFRPSSRMYGAPSTRTPARWSEVASAHRADFVPFTVSLFAPPV